MSQRDVHRSAARTLGAPSSAWHRPGGRPTEEEVVAALIGAGPPLGDMPALGRAVLYPMMLSAAAMLDLTEAAATSSLTLSRSLVGGLFKAVGHASAAHPRPAPGR